MNGSEYAGVLTLFMVVALAAAHAALESTAFAGTSVADSTPAADDVPLDWLWLVSCIVFVVFEVAAAASAMGARHFTPTRAVAMAGAIVLCLVGVRIRCLAIYGLGAAFARPPFGERAPSLQSTGVFAIVRHPSELGLTLFCAGLAVLVPEPPVLGVLFVMIAPLAVLRVVREERWLRAEFGARHQAYCVASPRLFWPRALDSASLLRLVAHLP